MMNYSLAQIEQAINYWRDVEDPHDGCSLGKTASKLAEVYGMMIYEGAVSVDGSGIEPSVVSDIELAIKRQNLPL